MPSLENRRVEIYPANTEEEGKNRILTEVINPSGNVQVVNSTITFRMGITSNIPGVTQIIIIFCLSDPARSFLNKTIQIIFLLISHILEISTN